MAKFVKGIFGPITGRLGGKIYSWSEEHGQQVKDRKPIDKWEFENDPKYKNQRDHCKENGRAAAAVTLMKDALGELLWFRADPELNRMMMSTMREVIKLDRTNEKGSRKPEYGNLSLFEGFEFNRSHIHGLTFRDDILTCIDRESGLLTIDFPSVCLPAPPGVDLFRVVSAGMAIDFEKKDYKVDRKISEWMLVRQSCPPLMLSHAIQPKSRSTLFLFAGIEYKLYGFPKLESGRYNVLTILKVDQYG